MVEENNKFPFQIEDLDDEEAAELQKIYDVDNYVLVGPEKYFMHSYYKHEGPKIYNMEIRPTDIFVVTFPRSGTTWTQELVWLLGSDLDYQTAENVYLVDRFPILDDFFTMNYEQLTGVIKSKLGSNLDEELVKFIRKVVIPGRQTLNEWPRTQKRFVKSHLPLSLMPAALLDTAKVVYVARHPLDVIVSNYYFIKLCIHKSYNGDFRKYCHLFMNDKYHRTPYFSHVKEAWSKRDHPNMLFLFYEDLRKDLSASVRRVADFLGTQPTEQQVAALCDHLSFDNFKNNKSVNYERLREFGVFKTDPHNAFIRKGKAGGWREHFDEDMAAQAQRWLDDNLRGTDLRFAAQ